MNIITALLTNGAFGYPGGSTRHRAPTVLAVLHQTSNTATAAQERNYANRSHSGGPSATAYIDKDGTIVRALNPKSQVAWSQGALRNPNLAIPTMKAIAASGVNPNEFVYESIECCGRGAEPFSAAQFEACAQLIATGARATGLPVNRNTVLTHHDFDSVNRASDPWPSTIREARVQRIISRANAILTPAPAKGFYTIKRNDNLINVAAAHGLSLAKLLAFPENARYRKNPGLIYVGNVVRVK
jgi:hypothetical protein